MKNNRDWKMVKKKLKNIIGMHIFFLLLKLTLKLAARNKADGVEWGFQVRCQKNSKFARVQSHNWESDNYNRLMNVELDVDEEQMSDGEEENISGGSTRR